MGVLVFAFGLFIQNNTIIINILCFKNKNHIIPYKVENNFFHMGFLRDL
jgi:hypothetical protein